MGKIYGSIVPSEISIGEEEYLKNLKEPNLVIPEEILDKILKEYEFSFFSWQTGVLYNILSAGSDNGSLRYPTCAYIIPRRNGKSYIIAAYMIIFALLGQEVHYTSYSGASAKEIYHLIYDRLNPKEWTRSPISAQNDARIVNKTTKGIIRIYTRASRIRGSGADKVIYDESQDLQERELSSLSPLTANSQQPQQIFLGTPMIPTLIDDKIVLLNDVFGEVIRNAKSNGLFFRWGTDEICTSKDDENMIAQCNPSYGYILNLDSFKTSPGSMLAFSVERMGYIFTEENSSLFDPVIYYNRCLDKDEITELSNLRPSYSISIKTTNEYAFVVRSVSAGEMDIFCDVVDTLNLSSTKLEDISDTILMYSMQPKCIHISIDGFHNDILKGILVSRGIFSEKKKNQKISFPSVTELSMACDFFLSLYEQKYISFYYSDYFYENIKNLKKRRISSGKYGYYSVNSEFIAPMFEAFAMSTRKLRMEK